MTYSWIVIAVMSVDIDRGKSLIAHVERAHGVLALPLDRIVELHHGRESDWDLWHVVHIRVSVSAA
jgi:hypothetical protein